MSNFEQSEIVTSDAGGHPRGLAMLFFAEMWERFCFYGMRSLLMLYMVSEVFKYNDETSANIYGSYNAMIYLTPLIGGIVADKLLGYRWTILIGGLFMAVGQFTLVVQQEFFFYTGMAFMVVGNGMFKPNISTLVGKLYGEGNDAKKDAGFTIFYIGINLGAFLATLICGYFAKTGDWTYGFGIAGVGMLVGIFTFARGKSRLEGHGEPPNPEAFSGHRAKVIVGGLLVVPVVYFLLREDQIVLWILIVAATSTLGYLLVIAFQSDKVAREKIFVLLILWVFHFLFWAFFEQAGTSMTLFTDRNIDLDLAGWEFPAAWGQFFNPLFILIFGSVFTLLWVKLSSIGKNPSIPIKFALGLIQLGAGFGVLVMGASWADDTGLVSLFILIFCYLLHTTGELCISPVGLSAVTKLAPARMTGMVMGVWFMSIAFAHKIGGKIAASMAVDTTTMTPADTLPVYADTFMIITYSAVGAGFLLMILTPLFLKKWLHGVK